MDRTLFVARIGITVLVAGMLTLMLNIGEEPEAGVAVLELDSAWEVKVKVLKMGSFKILSDGALVLERRARPGETFEVSAKHRVELHLPEVQAARVDCNGERVMLMGRQDVPRRLVFIDDTLQK